MKCPKCDYLGFETGDRCRHCGYDFSLSVRTPGPPDVALRVPEGAAVAAVGDLWLREQGRDSEAGAPGTGAAAAGTYPLFSATGPTDDEPLIRVPREPRAPLAVRRDPESPRVRPAAREPRLSRSLPVLDFAEEAAAELPAPPASPVTPPERAVPGGVSSLGRRGLAAVTDHAILFGVDAVVVYCTLRMAALPMSDWTMLPPAPFIAFLGMIKVSYFAAFTAMGGQTIGKMAVGIRVVGDQRTRVDLARAIRRTLTGAVSLLPFGLGLVPALLGVERRALHDRIAGTRVVDVPSH